MRRLPQNRMGRTALGHGFSWRDLIRLAGGLFLVWKATKEIHHNVDPDPGPDLFDTGAATTGFAAAIGQILVLDMVFSIDSIITAVGMTEHIPIMVIAVLVTVVVMLLAADPLANFIRANPTVVMLALGFLLLIGTTLPPRALGHTSPRLHLCRNGILRPHRRAQYAPPAGSAEAYRRGGSSSDDRDLNLGAWGGR